MHQIKKLGKTQSFCIFPLDIEVTFVKPLFTLTLLIRTDVFSCGVIVSKFFFLFEGAITFKISKAGAEGSLESAEVMLLGDN